jgi:hypothetical protein
MKKKYLWWALAGIGGAAALGAVLWGPIASQVERARYKRVARHRDIEIRDYAPLIVAETFVSGDREAAIRQGFRVLADYIFGDNTAFSVVAMTAPVTQQPRNESVAMTASVPAQANGADWTVRFVMPAHYTIDTLPQPNDPAVSIKQVEGKRYAAIRFSGFARDATLRGCTERLERFISAKRLRRLSPPAYAFYNPPWTLPVLRRNEIMIEVARGSECRP